MLEIQAVYQEREGRYAKSLVKVTLKEAEGRIILGISDDGPGINKEDRQKIFDRFYKGSKGHHGIGLSIVKTIVEEYKGTLSVQHAGIGTSFSIIFPI